MYGTVARIKIKPGALDDVLALMDEWDRDFKPKVAGVVAGYTYKLDSDPNTLILVAMFKDKASYQANADSPEQDKWYQRFRELMTTDPEWMDGEIVHDG